MFVEETQYHEHGNGLRNGGLSFEEFLLDGTQHHSLYVITTEMYQSQSLSENRSRDHSYRLREYQKSQNCWILLEIRIFNINLEFNLKEVNENQ